MHCGYTGGAKDADLVDTPGLGSVFKYHMQTSENWLPEVGAALLAISADRPLSEHDLSLIHELDRYTPRITLRWKFCPISHISIERQ